MRTRFLFPILVLLAATTSFADIKHFYNVEKMSGWGKCAECAGAGGTGPSGTVTLERYQSSPSLDGNSTRFFLGSTTPYTNGLFWRELIWPTQASTNRATHHFIYDAYFYLKSSAATGGLEWDINQYIDGKKYLFGTQCGYHTTGTWDVYDNINHKWVSTGVGCAVPTAYKWHHVTVEVERTTGGRVHYVSVTMDGSKHYLNRYYYPTSTSFSAVTVNYQMDGNKAATDYNTWLNKLTLTYW